MRPDTVNKTEDVVAYYLKYRNFKKTCACATFFTTDEVKALLTEEGIQLGPSRRQHMEYNRERVVRSWATVDHNDIARDLNVNSQTLVKYAREWGLPIKDGTPFTNRMEIYKDWIVKEWFSTPRIHLAQEAMVSVPTLIRYARRWGLPVGTLTKKEHMEFFRERITRDWKLVSREQLAKETGVSISTIDRYARKWGLPVETHRKVRLPRTLGEEYAAGATYIKLANKYGVSVFEIANKLRRLKVKLRT